MEDRLGWGDNYLFVIDGASMLTPAHPVIITLSSAAREVRSLLERASVFDPLCTLSFTESPDASGTTVPVYAPGMKQTGIGEIETEQITL